MARLTKLPEYYWWTKCMRGEEGGLAGSEDGKLTRKRETEREYIIQKLIDITSFRN